MFYDLVFVHYVLVMFSFGIIGIRKVWLKKKKNKAKSPSIWSRTPNSVRIRQSGRTGNRGVTSWYLSLGLGVPR